MSERKMCLSKGITTNLDHNRNSYAVMAKFLGKEASYRRKEKIFGRYYYECEKECFHGKEEETYYSQSGGNIKIRTQVDWSRYEDKTDSNHGRI